MVMVMVVVGLRVMLIYAIGITISPDGRFAYVTDTGANQAFYGYQDHYRPATM